MESPRDQSNNLGETYLRFRSAMQDVMGLLDQLDTMPVSAFLRQMRTAMVELYAAALALPGVEPETDTLTETKSTQGVSIYEKVAEKLGDAGRYWEVFDPTVEETPVRASLADDL